MIPLACQTIALPAFMEKILWWSTVPLHPRDEAKLLSFSVTMSGG
jgi:hypothetical protein